MNECPKLDPRRHAFRADLAAAELEGQVVAPRYVPGVVKQVVSDRTAIRREPRGDAALDTEALRGECVAVYDERDGWAWVQLKIDGYVGYTLLANLSSEIYSPTHRVTSVLAAIYREPSALSLPTGYAPFASFVSVVDIEAGFAKLATGGYVGLQLLSNLDLLHEDYVATAMRFMNLPYVFGGKTAFGIDCSGLVQNALQVAGQTAPRDSDMQVSEIGRRVDVGPDLAGLRRGDIVFWPGHTGIMVDEEVLVHATAAHMSVTLEQVNSVAKRARKDGPIVSDVRRPIPSD
ncbi:MAG: C40 family peptidase [Hyphomicrobiaceae bacterium]